MSETKCQNYIQQERCVDQCENQFKPNVQLKICSHNCIYNYDDNQCIDKCQEGMYITERICINDCSKLNMKVQLNHCVNKCNTRFKLDEQNICQLTNSNLKPTPDQSISDLELRQSVNIAEQVFRKKYNCASSVIYAANNGKENEDVKKAASFGGGKAPNGVCGALQSVIMLRPDLEDFILSKALKEFGSITCQGIKGQNKCKDCVFMSTQFLKKYGLE